ncbi:MAG: glucosaminidase domain-containing protein [Burkholderiales bacterium]|nr:glucosaminidase domain-containing protein [Bacteroidia bacterium]
MIMKKTFWLLLLLICTSAAAQQSTASKYVQLYKDAAIRQMNKNGVPASIILGVAMHESGSGTSKIAKYLNNHFGMKGRNNSSEIKSAYKGYESTEESYEDFIGALKRHQKFNMLFSKFSDSDYMGWAIGIQRGGYAASKTWARQVIAIIKKYELYKYDNQNISFIKPVDSPQEETMTSQTEASPTTVYRVKRGDTLLDIAKKFDTSVKVIKKKNNLRTANLRLGQKLEI